MLKNKIKKLCLIGGLMMSLLPFTHTAQAADKELIVATNLGFVPFEFTEKGKYVGFDVDLIDAIAQKLGLKYKWRTMEFGGLVSALQTNNVDMVIAGMTITPERQAVVDFSDPYYQAGLAVLTRLKDEHIKTTADLAGKPVAVQTGTVAVEYMKKEVPTAKLNYFPEVNNLYLDLLTGRSDAVVHDSPNVQYYAATAGKGKTRVTGFIDTNESYGIAFPKGSPLVAEVNKALKELKEDGTYDKIYSKWFGKIE
ncbi:glutamine ABC transporter substrate-binding protein GlnH [Basilea psittacipulmonis]|uniref:Glutamine ABC transporter substrate-bindnig protein n=1 Tax=Basilea psittacipulmonis DSM 24701 TaxID=1072685 RepID=A0A077DFW6_9BURK|nr:glutamine ABC transporter substrate-binding protein GlnH [Basilea psittacipulmonis]AIL32267.1 glutamine ABC transporter substrate-bindnig protein [Basilea psittacipulmonis DSM 24701]